jgi:ABC-type lipoprotein release transport system permease subunit
MGVLPVSSAGNHGSNAARRRRGRGVVRSLVYGIEAGNWTTTAAAGTVMSCLMVIAALVPARRAVNLHPTEALRVE